MNVRSFSESLLKESFLAFVRLLLLMGLLGSGSARADARTLMELLSEPVMTDESKNEIFRRAMDDPRNLFRALHPLWNQAGLDNRLRIRLAWVTTRFWYDDLNEHEQWNIESVFKEALTLLEQENIPTLADEIRFYQFEYNLVRQPNLLVDQRDALIRLARGMQDPRGKAYALAKLAFYMAERGLSDKNLSILVHDVRVLTNEQKAIESPFDMDTFTALSLTLETIGQTREAKAIDPLLDEACDRMKMRNYCSLRAYNKGRKVLALDDPGRTTEAKGFFLKALALSQEIQEKGNMAQSYYGLNLAYNASKDYKLAIPFGVEAAAIFEQMDAMDWAASALTHLSMSYLKNGQADEALAAAQRALDICPADFKDDQMKIHRQLAQVHESRGSFEAALKSLRTYLDMEQSMRTEAARKDYLELRNQSLFLQNEMQDQQIQLLKKFKIVSILAAGLSLGLCLALIFVWRQSSALRRSRQKIKDILDYIDQGIVTLDRHLHIQSGYSPHLHHIFGHVDQSFEGMTLLDLLFPAHSEEANQKILVQDTLLSCMGEQSLTWELNHGHLPHEIRHQNRILEVHWQALYNSHKNIESYLVTIRDISTIKRMQEDMEEESRRVTTLQKKLEEILKGNSALIRNFIHDLQASWDRMAEQIFLQNEHPMALRRLHTWKGSARSLGLNDLASALHAMESRIVASDLDQTVPQEQAWKVLSHSFEDYQHLLNTLMVSHRPEDLVPRNLYAFADLYAREMRRRLDAAGCPQVGVMVLDHIDQWNPDMLPRVHDIVLHALTNALDHGFIRPLQNQRFVAPARVQIFAYRSEDRVLLQITDNGVGLDWDKLKEKAADIGFIPGAGQSLADVLFLDGVSTAESLTETSGRGVGLSSVRSLCVDMGGQTFLEDNPSGGTTLRLEFPLAILLTDSHSLYTELQT